jgi:hypothetical protein
MEAEETVATPVCTYTLACNNHVYFCGVPVLIKQIQANVIKEFEITNGQLETQERLMLFWEIKLNKSLIAFTIQDTVFVHMEPTALLKEVSFMLRHHPTIRYVCLKPKNEVHYSSSSPQFHQVCEFIQHTTLCSYMLPTLIEVQHDDLPTFLDVIQKSCTRDFDVGVRSSSSNVYLKRLFALTSYLKHPLFDVVLAILHAKKTNTKTPVQIPDNFVRGLVKGLFQKMRMDIDRMRLDNVVLSPSPPPIA